MGVVLENTSRRWYKIIYDTRLYPLQWKCNDIKRYCLHKVKTRIGEELFLKYIIKQKIIIYLIKCNRIICSYWFFFQNYALRVVKSNIFDWIVNKKKNSTRAIRVKQTWLLDLQREKSSRSITYSNTKWVRMNFVSIVQAPDRSTTESRALKRRKISCERHGSSSKIYNIF